MSRGARRVLVVAWALVGGMSCHAAGPAPSPPSVAACPAPGLDVEAWRSVTDSAGVSYGVPPEFAEHPSPEVSHRQWQYEGTSSGSLAVGFIHSREFWLTLRRAPSPGMMEMSECMDSVAGREVLVQSWRTVGGTFRNFRRSDRYDVFGLLPIEPGLTLYVSGGGTDRRFQTLVLAMVRTVRISARR